MVMHRTIARTLVLLMLWLGGVAHAGTVTYVYTDPQGTPLAEADAAGNITATFDYAPYGSQALGSAPSGPGYTGHVNDPDTGLVYMQARYYDPQVGRFISTDPIGPAAGNPFNFNRFAYANNSPAVNIDPDGRCTGSLFSGCPDGRAVAGPGYIVPFVAPSPLGVGFSKNYEVKKDVTLGPDLESKVSKLADSYHQNTGHKLTVTDGLRSPRDQASRMLYKMMHGEGVSIYRNTAAANAIMDAYQAAVRDGTSPSGSMEQVIKSQVDHGVYISDHLTGRAVDFRSIGVSRAAFREAADSSGATKVLDEGVPAHLHVEY